MQSDIQISLPDGRKESFPKGTSVKEILGKVAPANTRWVAAKLDDKLVDLTRKVDEDSTLQGIGTDSPEALEILRHSAAHVMAQAVKSIFPEARVAIGPAIESGFYYDFDVAKPFTQDDLEKIEKKMREIVSQKLPFERSEVPREEAIGFFSKMGEKYKVELLEQFTDPSVSYLQTG